MKLSAIYIYFIILCSPFAYSQKEASIWYFGKNAGLKFDAAQDKPTILYDGRLVTNEGCSSICDSNGNLVMYTNGIGLWNKNHELIEGSSALAGHKSSTQSALIVPKPNNPGVYYVFTIDAMESKNEPSGIRGCRYYLVDATFGDGKGKVYNGRTIHGYSIEKLTAIKHSNGTDFWVVMHESLSNNFFAYRVRESGIDITPVLSKTGSVIMVESGCIGYMKPTADGKKIALALADKNIVEMFDFDNSTGIISNPVSIQDSLMQYPYGLEFSPNGNFLYVSTTLKSKRIFQFDISSNNAEVIKKSRHLVNESTKFDYGALQMAPDGKIYIANNGAGYLSTISFPNDSGVWCGFTHESVSFQTDTVISFLGLPNFYAGMFNSQVTIFTNSPVCEGETLKLHALIPANNTHSDEQWVGPDDNIRNGTDVEIENVTVDMSGIYKFWVNINGTFQSFETSIRILPKPMAFLENDNLSVCEKGYSTIRVIKPDTANYTFLWSTGEVSDSIRVTKEGTYSVTVTNEAGCSEILFANVIKGTMEEVEILPQKSPYICADKEIELSVKKDYSSYEWSTGEKTKSIIVNRMGIYTVTVTDSYGCTGTASATVNFYPQPNVRIVGNSYVCRGMETKLEANNDFEEYEWSTGESTKQIYITQPGKYSLRVTDRNGCSKIVSTTITELNIELTGLDNIEFNKVLTGEYSSKTITITNSGNTPVFINNINMKTASTPFDVSSFPPWPYGLDIGKSMKIIVEFDPVYIDNYKDSLQISISTPCSIVYKVCVSGAGYGKTLVWIPDTIAMPGIKDYRIPIRTRALNNIKLHSPLIYTGEISFHVSALYPSSALGQVIGDYRYIPITQAGITPKAQPIELASINGLIMVADSEVVELKINNFTWSNPLVEPEIKNGSLTIFLCQSTIVRIKTYVPTTIDISPNPSDNNIKVNITSEETGSFGFYIYNAQGQNLYTEEWYGTGKHEKQILPDIKQLSAGVYQAALRTPAGYLTKPLVIVK